MKKSIFHSLLSLSLGLSVILTAEPRVLTALRGYQLREVPAAAGDFNIWVVTHAAGFDSTFTEAEAGGLRPDFEKQLVIGVNAVTHNFSYLAEFTRARVDKDGLHVYFKMRKQRAGEHPAAVSLAAIERMPGLRLVHFYHDDVKVRTVPIVAVY